MDAGYDHPPRTGAPGGAYAIRPYTGTHLNEPTGRKAPTSQQFNGASVDAPEASESVKTRR